MMQTFLRPETMQPLMRPLVTSWKAVALPSLPLTRNFPISPAHLFVLCCLACCALGEFH